MQSMSPAITGIHHVTFVVTDLETGKAWFGRVFDDKVQFQEDQVDP